MNWSGSVQNFKICFLSVHFLFCLVIPCLVEGLLKPFFPQASTKLGVCMTFCGNIKRNMVGVFFVYLFIRYCLSPPLFLCQSIGRGGSGRRNGNLPEGNYIY